jgi:Na+/H+ antiporter NhaD/arsenite permease-like protein
LQFYFEKYESIMNFQQWLTDGIIILTLVGIAAGSIPALRMNRATISLVGIVALLFTGSFTSAEEWQLIDFNTIALLLGMMMLNANLRISGFFDYISVRITRYAKTPRQLLVSVVFASGLLSAFFLNDTVCIILTPLILEITLSLRRNPIPYLMAAATAANVGSVATVIGNPQNMVIAMASRTGFLNFMIALAPAAIVGLVIVILVLMLIYRTEFSGIPFEKFVEKPVFIYKPLFVKSLIATGMMIFFLFLGFPIPLCALGAAAILSVTRRLKPKRVFQEIDWSLLVFFSALFMITGSLAKTNIGAYLKEFLSGNQIHQLGLLTMISGAMSNIISNVPAVMLYIPVLGAGKDAFPQWITLAMATTFAGNLTLLGSMANLIVAESAKRRGVELSFTEYLKSGVLIAILTMGFGVFWISHFIRV